MSIFQSNGYAKIKAKYRCIWDHWSPLHPTHRWNCLRRSGSKVLLDSITGLALWWKQKWIVISQYMCLLQGLAYMTLKSNFRKTQFQNFYTILSIPNLHRWAIFKTDFCKYLQNAKIHSENNTVYRNHFKNMFFTNLIY